MKLSIALAPAFVALLWGACAASCNVVAGDGRETDAAPASDAFAPVSDMLEARCGSLDCHGQDGRSLRIYGTFGLRLSEQSRTGQGATTAEEYEATYESLITLEPAALGAVINEHAGPERLTLVRKARGDEHHKGGAVLAQGSPGDTCLVSWLETGTPDAKACGSGADVEVPVAW